MIVDIYIVYKILRKLTSDFSDWEGHKAGVIDSDGKILVDKRKRTPEMKKAFTKLDYMILNLKNLIARNPMGARKISNMAAALWLIKEDLDIDIDMITEENLDEHVASLVQLIEDGEGTPPTNNVGNVAGSDGTEPGVSKTHQKSIRKKNKKKGPVLRGIINKV